jgi:hypothetical protein
MSNSMMRQPQLNMLNSNMEMNIPQMTQKPTNMSNSMMRQQQLNMLNSNMEMNNQMEQSLDMSGSMMASSLRRIQKPTDMSNSMMRQPQLNMLNSNMEMNIPQMTQTPSDISSCQIELERTKNMLDTMKKQLNMGIQTANITQKPSDMSDSMMRQRLNMSNSNMEMNMPQMTQKPSDMSDSMMRQRLNMSNSNMEMNMPQMTQKPSDMSDSMMRQRLNISNSNMEMNMSQMTQKPSDMSDSKIELSKFKNFINSEMDEINSPISNISRSYIDTSNYQTSIPKSVSHRSMIENKSSINQQNTFKANDVNFNKTLIKDVCRK